MITSLLTSIGLGVGAGINAYATLLVYGLLARFAGLRGELAEFFSSTPVLIAVGLLYCVEFIADKVPAVDHVWDIIHTFVRPAAGAVVAWAAVSDKVPHGVLILASALGGGAALGAHAAKAAIRGASTAATGGLGNPILSLFEDIFAFSTAIIAVILPWLVIAVVLSVTFFFLTLWRRVRGPSGAT